MSISRFFGTSRWPFFLLSTALWLATSAANGQSANLDRALEHRFLNASPYSIAADDQLNELVEDLAQGAIEEHCASCHGADLMGRPGVPNLVDFDWLWGITLEETNEVGPVMELIQTITYGVRNTDCPDIEDVSYYGGCADTRFSQMPGYGDQDVFNDDQISDLTEYVLKISGQRANEDAATRGQELWPICIECHGADGYGYKPYGGPDLTDDVWLFGDDRATIHDVIKSGRTEVCPPWGKTLDPVTIKALAVYIWRRANGG